MEETLDWRFKLQYFLAKVLVRLGRIRQEVFSMEEINEMLQQEMPQHFHLELPASQGELIIVGVEASALPQQDKLQLQAFASFTIEAASQRVYQAHLVITGEVLPYYCQQTKAVKLKHHRIDEVRLINDEYAFIQSASSILNSLIPSPLSGLITATVSTTLGMLKAFTPQEATSYLTLFSKGNMQKVLDYHKPMIEQELANEIAAGELDVIMDETIFEEKLFAELGKELVIENQQVVFKF